MNDFKIEKNIPLPKDSGGGVKKYPFTTMSPHESVFIAGANINGNEYSACRRIAHYRRGKGEQCKFTARTVDGGIRIWRTE